MNELTELALELQEFCEERNWRFCLIGGLALQYWGEPRLTKDVDMTLMAGFGNEEVYIREWLAAYESRIPDPENFAIANRVLLLRSDKGIGIDIALGALPFEGTAIDRAEKMELEPGAMLRLCTAEDLIVMKAFANRPQDRVDLRGIIVRQGLNKLDWEYVWTNLKPLVEIKNEPEIIAYLEGLIRETQAAE